jgi:hypothetical protein
LYFLDAIYVFRFHFCVLWNPTAAANESNTSISVAGKPDYQTGRAKAAQAACGFFGALCKAAGRI